MEERLDGAIDLLVALALLVDVADVVDDVPMEHLAQPLVGNARHDAEEQFEQIKGRDGALVPHEDEGRDARLADVAVELDGRGGDGHGHQISSTTTATAGSGSIAIAIGSPSSRIGALSQQ